MLSFCRDHSVSKSRNRRKKVSSNCSLPCDLLILALSVLLLLTSAPQSSCSQPMKDGKPVTGPNIDSARGFGAQLWITEHEEFFHEFAGGGTIKFEGTTNVRRDVPVFLTFFIAGPGIDASGAAAVTADITVRKPDGTVYFEEKDAPCWRGKYPYAPDSTQVADAKVKLRIESKDPAGKYLVEAIVHDKVKKVDLSLKKTFDVAE